MGCLIEPPLHVRPASVGAETAGHRQETGRKFLGNLGIITAYRPAFAAFVACTVPVIEKRPRGGVRG